MDKIKHISGLDYLRIIAAFSVVWIHGSDLNNLARSFQTYTSFAVPCFILVSFFLAQKKLAGESDVTYQGFIISRLRRIVPAYLAWSMIYLLFRFVKRTFVTRLPFDVDWASVFFFGGASYQLWFVPALLIWSVSFSPLMFIDIKKPFYTVWGILLVVTGFGFVLFGSEMQGGFKMPAGYEMFVHMSGCTGYVLIGMGAWWLFSSINNHGFEAKKKERINAIVFKFISGCWFTAFLFGSITADKMKEYFVPLYSIGVFLFFVAFVFPQKKMIYQYLAPCSFGIYLCHGLFVEGLQVFIGMGGFDITSFSITFFIVTASFIVSMLLCACLMRNKYTKWLVL